MTDTPDPRSAYPPPGQQGYPPPGYGPQGYGAPQGYGPPPGYGPPATHAPLVPLRPLGVGDVLGGAVRFIGTNPLVIIGVSAAAAVLSQVFTVAGQAMLPTSPTSPETAGMAAGSSALSLVGGLVSLVATAIVTGLLLAMLDGAVRGRRVALGEAWSRTSRRIPGLVGLTLLTVLIVAVPVLLLMIPLFIVVASGGSPAVAVVLGLLALVVAVYLSVLLSLASPAYVVEGLGVGAALGRSRRLVTGAWWRTFGVLLLAGLLSAIPVVIVFSVIGFDQLSAPGVTASGLFLLGAIATVVLSAVLTPFFLAVTGLMHLNRRIRREQSDAGLGGR